MVPHCTLIYVSVVINGAEFLNMIKGSLYVFLYETPVDGSCLFSVHLTIESFVFFLAHRNSLYVLYIKPLMLYVQHILSPIQRLISLFGLLINIYS